MTRKKTAVILDVLQGLLTKSADKYVEKHSTECQQYKLIQRELMNMKQMVKQQRAQGECLGIGSRRRT